MPDAGSTPSPFALSLGVAAPVLPVVDVDPSDGTVVEVLPSPPVIGGVDEMGEPLGPDDEPPKEPFPLGRPGPVPGRVGAEGPAGFDGLPGDAGGRVDEGPDEGAVVAGGSPSEGTVQSLPGS